MARQQAPTLPLHPHIFLLHYPLGPLGPSYGKSSFLELSRTASTAMMMGESMVRLASGQILADYGATKVKPLAPPKPKRLLPED